MTRRSLPVILCAAVIAILPLAAPAAAQSTADEPELVMITLRPKPGAEAALAEVIARHFETARQLNLLVPDAPHMTLRSDEPRVPTFFVEVFTWRSAAAPDNAPPAIQAIWKEMNALVEPRNGR